MNIKKVLLFTVVLMIAISSLSIVSAGLFDFGQENIINVGGNQFNIPSDFKLVKNDSWTNNGQNISQVLYKNGEKQCIITVVENFTGTLPENSSVVLISGSYVVGAGPVQINNTIVGLKAGKTFSTASGVYVHHTFEYVENGKLIVITVPEETSFQVIMR